MVANSRAFARCAATKTVLPGRAAMLARTSASVFPSSALVTSSSTITGAPEHTARDGQALELPLGEPLPVLADHRVEPQRKLLHKIPRARRLARVPDLVVICVGSRKRHVLAHRPRKQEVVLRHIREHPRRHLGRGARRALLKLVRKAVGVVGAQRQSEGPSTAHILTTSLIMVVRIDRTEVAEHGSGSQSTPQPWHKTKRSRYPISETSSSGANSPAFTQVFLGSSASILAVFDLGYRLRRFFAQQPRRAYFRARKPPWAMWSRRCCSIWASTSRSMAPSCCSSPPSEVRPISCMTSISISWP